MMNFGCHVHHNSCNACTLTTNTLFTSFFFFFFFFFSYCCCCWLSFQDESTAKVIGSLKRVFKLLLDGTAASAKELGKAEFDLLGQVKSMW
jgi:hypothetical protein